LAKQFDTVTFRNGYSGNAPTITVECLGISIGTAKPEWSDNWQGQVFVINLGEVIAIDKILVFDGGEDLRSIDELLNPQTQTK